MPNPSLIDIVHDWIKDLKSPLFCEGLQILHPCYCGSPIIFAIVFDTEVRLIRAMCDCVDCSRHSVNVAAPTSLEDLRKSLISRMDHKSVNVCGDAKTGDDLRHLVSHNKGGTLNISGHFSDVNVNVSQVKLNIDNAVITNCQFTDITEPIGISGEVTFTNNALYASPKMPPPTMMAWGDDSNGIIAGCLFSGF